eukprot:2159884-Amphidinium_carterae.1
MLTTLLEIESVKAATLDTLSRAQRRLPACASNRVRVTCASSNHLEYLYLPRLTVCTGWLKKSINSTAAHPTVRPAHACHLTGANCLQKPRQHPKLSVT